MHVITFYSFKGGVGRTMALTNVAVQLAQSGRRVLVVDFDLEAPGIDTLSLGSQDSPPKKSPGVVDFVSDYLGTGVVPDVSDYIYEAAGAGKDSGALWVMPAGIDDGSYAERLSHINWADLYDFHDGFVLFEDLKQQWARTLLPDYVLIDSRTGHTDVGGICTRQLADAVVLVFIPNQQNLRGLIRVAEDIRNEAAPPRDKRIVLHFVMSNVPDIDDEDAILAGRLKEFRRSLHMRERPFVIHRYDSLSLLTQSVFTRDRPRSRLAREYRQLTGRLQRANPSDASGAIEFLGSILQDRVSMPVREVEEALERIRNSQSTNGEVLARLARVRLSQGRAAEGAGLLEEAVALGYETAETLVSLAEAQQLLNRGVLAASHARRAFEYPVERINVLSRALEVLRKTDPSLVVGIGESVGLATIKDSFDKYWFATQLQMSRQEWYEARKLLESPGVVPRLAEGAKNDSEISVILPESLNSLAFHDYVLCLIGLRDFKLARSLIEPRLEVEYPDIALLFNYAIAAWGEEGFPTTAYFSRVVKANRSSLGSDSGVNYLQCMALCLWQVGDVQQATEVIERAQLVVSQQVSPEFSCWTYLKEGPTEFARDLVEMKRLFAGEIVRPRFLPPP